MSIQSNICLTEASRRVRSRIHLFVFNAAARRCEGPVLAPEVPELRAARVHVSNCTGVGARAGDI